MEKVICILMLSTALPIITGSGANRSESTSSDDTLLGSTSPTGKPGSPLYYRGQVLPFRHSSHAEEEIKEIRPDTAELERLTERAKNYSRESLATIESQIKRFEEEKVLIETELLVASTNKIGVEQGLIMLPNPYLTF